MIDYCQPVFPVKIRGDRFPDQMAAKKWSRTRQC
jgi:hypothetical protein